MPELPLFIYDADLARQTVRLARFKIDKPLSLFAGALVGIGGW